MEMTDREPIQEMIATYANAFDTEDYDGVGACFMADAEIIYAGFSGPLIGHDKILDHMKLALEPLEATQHMFSNFIIDISGDQAKLTAYVLAQHQKAGESFLSGGRYHLDVARDGGKWKIAGGAPKQMQADVNRDLLPKAG